jgi:hypothetical protein
MSGVLALAVAIGIVFGAHKLCDVIKAPPWFAKLLFVYAFIVITYFLAEEIVPDSKKPWGIWVAMLGAATGIIPVGFIVGGFKFQVQRVNDGAVAHRLPGA